MFLFRWGNASVNREINGARELLPAFVVVAVALHFMHYNFVRVHQTLRCTPAMAAGVSKTLWSIEDIVNLLNDAKSLKRVA